MDQMVAKEDEEEEEKGGDKKEKSNEQEKGMDAMKRAGGRGIKDVYNARLRTFEKMRVKSFSVVLRENRRSRCRKMKGEISDLSPDLTLLL